MAVLIPDLLWRDGRFERGLALEYDPANGRILRVEPADKPNPDGHEASDIRRLPGRALLPGFVNAHSHAFQRLIRGRTQWRSTARPDADFRSWREAMYRAALALPPDDVEAVSRFCFLEMLRAGYTTVGEFHYLHRDREGQPYPDPNELAHRVIRAAREVGIRIALLNVCYATGDIGEPLGPDQRRFGTPGIESYLADTQALMDAYASTGSAGGRGEPVGSGHVRPANPSTANETLQVTVGVAPHSVRAVPREWLAPLHAWAAERDVAFHIHASEQPGEVESCVEAYGLRPIELLAAESVLDERTTAIHATHLNETELALLGDARATVCACPTTERDLGDGFLRGRELLDAGARVAFGSDSHTVIDPFEEMRLVEYHERLRRLERVVLTTPTTDGRLETAPLLLNMATAGGARALRLDAGRLEGGALADFIAVDLDHHTLAGWTPDSLAAMLALSAPAAVVSDVWVGGVRRIEAGQHAAAQTATAAFRRAAGRIE